MKKIFYFLIVTGSLLFSCNSEIKQGDLLEIPVDITQNISLPLSEITEDLTSVEMELTDESLINIDEIILIIVLKDYIFLMQEDILVFDRSGIFIRKIGSKGQGPGEYNNLCNMTVDEINKRLFIVSHSPSKIICYNFDGKLLNESLINYAYIYDINFINEELLVVGDKYEKNGVINSAMYRLGEGFNVKDTFTLWSTPLGDVTTFATSASNKDFILNNNSIVFLFFSNNLFLRGPNPAKTILRDTLYRFGENRLVPELKLKFKDNGIDSEGKRFIDLFNIYRSSRYVFSNYQNNMDKNRYYFCYDTKTGKGYNMQGGYTDDINGIEKRIRIRPLITDAEMFYYLYTHMKPDDFEEPNPTLYIGKLKK